MKKRYPIGTEVYIKEGTEYYYQQPFKNGEKVKGVININDYNGGNGFCYWVKFDDAENSYRTQDLELASSEINYEVY